MNKLELLLNQIIAFCTTAGIKIIISIVVLVIGFKLIKVLTRGIKKGKATEKLDKSVTSFLSSFTNIALKILLVIIVASYLGLPMASMVAVLGSAGLALGLSLQGSLSNLAGGIMILIFKPFSVGDFITAGGNSGTVTDIGIFYTKLLTGDNRVIVIPNGAISNQSITNASLKSDRRVDFEFTASYDADIDAVKKILIDTALKNNLVKTEPAPFAGLSKHGDSALVYVLRVWCDAADYWTVYFDVNENVKRALDAAEISIPYPQLDVHMDK